MLKKIAIAVALIIIVVFTVAAAAVFLTGTEVSAEREVVINKPRDEVFAYVKQVKNQNEWGTWYKRDPGMKQETTGTDGTAGFVSRWESTNPEVGSGEQEIKRIVEGERIDTELRFKAPFESKADAYLVTEPVGAAQTRVRWGFRTEMPRPMNLMLLVMDLEQAIGKDYEEGLANLKQILERP